ncbi:MAG: endonuclease/exonuclease/phosphatase family protein [Chloroflexi bacterium]|nr:endonuclease/exonuclease/phosphatase family protein [Chloroflexota bacterium]
MDVVAGYGLSWWLGDRFLPVRLFHYFMPWLLAGLIPGLFLAGLARRKWMSLALAAPTFLVSLTFAPLFLPRPENVLAADTLLKVMSHNVWYHNRSAAEVASLIRQEQPDILLLQELSPAMARKLKGELIDLYSGEQLYLAYEPKAYQGIISRFPLTPVELAYEKGRAQKVVAATPAGPIAVWNVHPNAPLPWRRQYRQLSSLTEDIAAVEGPLIVGGDFNTTDQSETYRLVSQYLYNAHWEAGWGFGFSFPAHQPRFRKIPILTPVVRIDHIFYSHHFFARSAHTLNESGGSDHLPVTAELSLVQ